MNISNFIQELRRRNVFKVAVAYAIAGWLIIQIAATVFPAFEFPAWTTQFIIIVVAIGFPLTLIFAWAFELTPDGIKKSREVDITESVTNRTGKKLNGIIIGVLSVALFFVLVERIFFAKASILEDAIAESQVETASIAVLPFVNMSSDQENEYFSDGLSEELLNALAKEENMKVAGRTSSFKFKGQNENLSIIGEELGVAHILEGSVRKDGNRIRITAQLIKVDDGYHMWSETYDRELTDIFSIQEEISRTVLNELKVRLLSETEQDDIPLLNTDVEAYNAYLKATQLEATRDTENMLQAIEYYKEAIKIDPTFALAYARLASLYEIVDAFISTSPEERRRLVRENVDKALLIDSNLAEAYAALGLFYTSDGVIEEAVLSFNKAIELNPNYAIAYTWLGNTYNGFDDNEAAKAYKKAYELDPLHSVNQSNYGFSLVIENKLEEATQFYNDQIANNPDHSLFSYYRLSDIYGVYTDQMPKAIEILYTSLEKDEDSSVAIAYLSSYGSYNYMLEYSKMMNDKLVEALPENFATKLSKAWLDFFAGNYEELLKFIEFDYMKNQGFGSISYDLVHQSFYASIYEDRKDFFEKLVLYYEPEFSDSEFTLTLDNEELALYYSKILTVEERYDELEKFKIAFCELANQTAEEAKNNSDYDDHFLSNLSCAQLNNDFDTFKEWYLQYSENTTSYLINSDILERFPRWDFLETDDPEITALQEKAYAIVTQQITDTIEIIRENGDWDESWESDVVTILARAQGN